MSNLLTFEEFKSTVSDSDFIEYYSWYSPKLTALHFNCEKMDVYRRADELGYEKPPRISNLYDFMLLYTLNEFRDYFLCHTTEDTQRKFRLNKDFMYEILKEFDIRKDNSQILEIKKERSREKYGTDFPIQNEEVKSKIFTEEKLEERNKKTKLTIQQDEDFWKKRDAKSRETKLSRYGNETYNNREKFKETCLDKYGKESYAGTEDHIEKSKITRINNSGSLENSYKIGSIKAKDTCLKKYGVECSLSSDDSFLNGHDTIKNKFGNEYISKTDYWHDQVSETNIQKYGVPWACMRDEARNYSNDSKPNCVFSNKLDEFNLIYKREFPIGGKSYDFKIGNDLIEINPYATHNSTFGIFDDKGKDKYYHRDKSVLAKENGFRCIHVWDWDDYEKIIQMLLPKEKIYARNCKLAVIEDASVVKSFIESYHLQGSCNGQTYCYGLYHNDELVQVMTFGKPRYNKNYEYELLRLCTKFGYYVVGGAERLFKKFLSDISPKSILSYCDNSKFNGDVYKRLGFKLQSKGSPSKHWFNPKTQMHITDNLLRQRGFDQLFGTSYGKNTSNKQLMIENDFVEIYDCGQSTYVMNFNKNNI